MTGKNTRWVRPVQSFQQRQTRQQRPVVKRLCLCDQQSGLAKCRYPFRHRSGHDRTGPGGVADRSGAVDAVARRFPVESGDGQPGARRAGTGFCGGRRGSSALAAFGDAGNGNQLDQHFRDPAGQYQPAHPGRGADAIVIGRRLFGGDGQQRQRRDLSRRRPRSAPA